MSAENFYRLAPFIQDYVYRKKWAALKPVQNQAISAILDSSEHVLISSGTASGKTEAAMLPILSELFEKPSSTIGVMYIGPLKALINDQFERLTELLEGTEFPIQSWHGDVSQEKKERFLRRAQGILQITPESLEAMLINRHHELGRLFSDLRFVVIDEIHAFIDSDRGRQVMCQLERLASLQKVPARRVGLSATLGNPQLAKDWLRGNSKLEVQLIESKGDRSLELGMEYFLLEPDKDEAHEVEATPEQDELDTEAQLNETETTDELDALLDTKLAFHEHIHKMTQRVSKTLLFANQRADVEAITVSLRQLSERKGSPDIYYAHHGSISAPLREDAEMTMRNPEKKACVAATVTLELGIDIGQLDQVLQVNSSHSVSSFVQRLGRSGRRGGPSRMFFYSTEEKEAGRHFAEELPWNLLQNIAIIQLYLEEQWIEPPKIPQMPFSLLYQQTMSTILAHTELLPPQLAQKVLSLSVFKNINVEQYRALLLHLIETKHLEQTDIDGLIIGEAAEKLVNNFRFYATFEDNVEYRVRDKSREIGTIQSLPEVGSTISLAGYAWRVLDRETEKRLIHVERVKGRAKAQWTGSGVQLHRKVIQKIREVLLSDNEYSYLHDRAEKRLEIARRSAQAHGLADASILPISPSAYLVFPWIGSREFATQCLIMEASGLKIKAQYRPYYYELTYSDDETPLKQRLLEIVQSCPSTTELAERLRPEELLRAKFDPFIPELLLQEAYAMDYLEREAAVENLVEMVKG